MDHRQIRSPRSDDSEVEWSMPQILLLFCAALFGFIVGLLYSDLRKAQNKPSNTGSIIKRVVAISLVVFLLTVPVAVKAQTGSDPGVIFVLVGPIPETHRDCTDIVNSNDWLAYYLWGSAVLVGYNPHWACPA